MRRSLFFRIFVAVFAAIAVAAAALLAESPSVTTSTSRAILVGLPVAIFLAAASAACITWSVRRGATSLERLALSFPHPNALEQRSSNLHVFDRIAAALANASESSRAALANAAASRHELEALLDSMQNAVVAVDAAGRIQWTNREMQKLIPGSSVSGAVRIGHALVQTIRDPEVLACMRTVLDEGIVCQRRTTTLLPGRIFEVNASPMPGGGAVAVLHDITRIEQVERTQRDFVANVSHELRTPLTSISGYVETLLDHETLTPAARDFLTVILKNTTRMQRLTDDLLTMARVESREAELHPEPVAADMLVHDAVEAMRGLAQETGATIEVGPAAAADVIADPDSVVQILGNLIENGIKYGQTRSTGRSRIVVAARIVPEQNGSAPAVEFSVRDYGQGIASEHLSRIFERFYRVDKARSRDSGGTGLGLAIARHVVELQGGSIRAESSLGQGTEFLVLLPLAQLPVSKPLSPDFNRV